ncbi:MAG: oxidoreductase, partial [Anaerolineae bacterium]|nr:oxidoreductase [Anaerolineae bacterium]
HQWVHRRTNPMILNYRMNAGYLPLDHWVHTTEGGGRNLGEACHIYDLFTFLTGSRVMDIQAYNIAPATQYYSARDNFAAVIKFEDGSVATLTYTALGSTEYPKEQMEIFVDGRVIVLDDYKRLAVVGSKGKGIESTVVDKGHREELEAFGHSIQQGGTWAIPLWEQIQATEIALRVEAQLR